MELFGSIAVEVSSAMRHTYTINVVALGDLALLSKQDKRSGRQCRHRIRHPQRQWLRLIQPTVPREPFSSFRPFTNTPAPPSPKQSHRLESNHPLATQHLTLKDISKQSQPTSPASHPLLCHPASQSVVFLNLSTTPPFLPPFP